MLGGDIADAQPQGIGVPADRLHAAGAGQEPLSRPERPREHRIFRPPVRTIPDEREWRIAELLDSTGLAPFADRPAKKLSGGMRQKLGLCCSLIHDPDLLILDEPTTGVDPLSRRQFWELIDRIRSRRPGMSVIVATAYMEEAERFDWLVGDECREGAGNRLPGRTQERAPAPAPWKRRSSRCCRKSCAQGHHALEIPPRRIFDARADHHRRAT